MYVFASIVLKGKEVKGSLIELKTIHIIFLSSKLANVVFIDKLDGFF